jgi:hypothetical protein
MEQANLFFFGVYVFEFLLKLFALGLFEYFADSFNRFDAFVVLLSTAEVVSRYLNVTLPVEFQLLRAFRLLRIFKLLRDWDSLYLVLSALVDTLANLRDLMIILVTTLFVFALLGMQLFGHGQVRPHAERVPASFSFVASAMVAHAHARCVLGAIWWRARARCVLCKCSVR